MRKSNTHSIPVLGIVVALALTCAAAVSALAASAGVPGPWKPPLSTMRGADDGRLVASLIPIRPAPRETVPVAGVIEYRETLPVTRHRQMPEYPAMAREARVSGVVMTRVLVGADGRVEEVRVDPAHSVLMLDDAAVAAARRWTFTPATVCGRPVSVWITVPFAFRLP
jgi:TonB family protein